ncbi:M23 family metallopeptidase [Alteromonas facilis]|uniref:M23 family metallopeptidase n=1 Tax=Alteromonas facilis TaxID=2048004 RepID=UPI000C2926C7|nr:M23 family metallopeptidase [Alteromonas facilis]
MKFTLLIRSKRFKLVKHIKARTLVSMTVLLSLVVLVSSRPTENIDEYIARIHVVKSGLLTEQARVAQLQKQTLSELAVVKQQIAETQAKLLEISVRNQHLATSSGIDIQDPNVNHVADAATVTVNIDNESLVSPLVDSIAAVNEQLLQQVKQLDALESVLLGHHIQDISEVAGRPVKSGWLSSYYGMRDDPFTGEPAMHKGIDFAGSDGDPVIATAAGLVTWAGERYGYGNLVEIDHGNGLVSRYGHNAGLQVTMGDVVTKGQQIATMGSTGRSTGTHVHYEVLRQGQQIDPLPFVY